MDTQKIINAISEISDTMSNGDQVTAYNVNEFTGFVAEQVKNEFGSDETAARATVPEWFDTLDAAKKHTGKLVIIVNLFKGEDASECYCLLDDLDRATLQDYTAANNHAQRLALLELKDEYKKI